MLTIKRTIHTPQGDKTGTYRKTYKTLAGAENFRNQLINLGVNPDDLTIEGNPEPRKTRSNDVAGRVRIGDVFRCTWGYDMLINDFYKVTKVSPSGKTVTLQPIGKTVVSGDLNSPQGAEVSPDINDTKGRPIPGKRVQASGTRVYITMNSFAVAYLMSEADFARTYTECHWD